MRPRRTKDENMGKLPPVCVTAPRRNSIPQVLIPYNSSLVPDGTLRNISPVSNPLVAVVQNTSATIASNKTATEGMNSNNQEAMTTPGPGDTCGPAEPITKSKQPRGRGRGPTTNNSLPANPMALNISSRTRSGSASSARSVTSSARLTPALSTTHTAPVKTQANANSGPESGAPAGVTLPAYPSLPRASNFKATTVAPETNGNTLQQQTNNTQLTNVSNQATNTSSNIIQPGQVDDDLPNNVPDNIDYSRARPSILQSPQSAGFPPPHFLSHPQSAFVQGRVYDLPNSCNRQPDRKPHAGGDIAKAVDLLDAESQAHASDYDASLEVEQRMTQSNHTAPPRNQLHTYSRPAEAKPANGTWIGGQTRFSTAGLQLHRSGQVIQRTTFDDRPATPGSSHRQLVNESSATTRGASQNPAVTTNTNLQFFPQPPTPSTPRSLVAVTPTVWAQSTSRPVLLPNSANNTQPTYGAPFSTPFSDRAPAHDDVLTSTGISYGTHYLPQMSHSQPYWSTSNAQAVHSTTIGNGQLTDRRSPPFIGVPRSTPQCHKSELRESIHPPDSDSAGFRMMNPYAAPVPSFNQSPSTILAKNGAASDRQSSALPNSITPTSGIALNTTQDRSLPVSAEMGQMTLVPTPNVRTSQSLNIEQTQFQTPIAGMAQESPSVGQPTLTMHTARERRASFQGALSMQHPGSVDEIVSPHARRTREKFDQQYPPLQDNFVGPNLPADSSQGFGGQKRKRTEGDDAKEYRPHPPAFYGNTPARYPPWQSFSPPRVIIQLQEYQPQAPRQREQQQIPPKSYTTVQTTPQPRAGNVVETDDGRYISLQDLDNQQSSPPMQKAVREGWAPLDPDVDELLALYTPLALLVPPRSLPLTVREQTQNDDATLKILKRWTAFWQDLDYDDGRDLEARRIFATNMGKVVGVAIYKGALRRKGHGGGEALAGIIDYFAKYSRNLASQINGLTPDERKDLDAEFEEYGKVSTLYWKRSDIAFFGIAARAISFMITNCGEQSCRASLMQSNASIGSGSGLQPTYGSNMPEGHSQRPGSFPNISVFDSPLRAIVENTSHVGRQIQLQLQHNQRNIDAGEPVSGQLVTLMKRLSSTAVLVRSLERSAALNTQMRKDGQPYTNLFHESSIPLRCMRGYIQQIPTIVRKHQQLMAAAQTPAEKNSIMDSCYARFSKLAQRHAAQLIQFGQQSSIIQSPSGSGQNKSPEAASHGSAPIQQSSWQQAAVAEQVPGSSC